MTEKARLWLCALLALAILLWGGRPVHADSQRVSVGKFSIWMLPGWEAMTSGFPEGISPDVKLFLLAPASDRDFRPNINLLIQSAGGLTLADYMKANRHDLEESLKAKIYEDTTMTINGRAAGRLVFSATFDGRELKDQATAFVVSDTLYLVTASSSVDTFDRHVKDFSDTVGTSRISD